MDMKNRTFDLQKAKSMQELPACRGAEVLAILTEVNPIEDPEEQRYSERVEKFANNFIIRRIMGEITIPFIEAVVERMFTADEVSPPSVTGSVDPGKLALLKFKITQLFFSDLPTWDEEDLHHNN
jgi:hypothetical protein